MRRGREAQLWLELLEGAQAAVRRLRAWRLLAPANGAAGSLTAQVFSHHILCSRSLDRMLACLPAEYVPPRQAAPPGPTFTQSPGSSAAQLSSVQAQRASNTPARS